MFPAPPVELLSIPTHSFAPAHEIRDWAFTNFIEADSKFCNEDHRHLEHASILFLWSALPFKKTGKYVVGTAQLGLQQGSLGKKEFLEWQYRKWNGGKLPDFVITICAGYVKEAAPEAICALVEHELYHCGQKRNAFGVPMFSNGRPAYAMRGHDVEVFIGEVQRYGAIDENVQALVKAAQAKPIISGRNARAICGCGLTIA